MSLTISGTCDFSIGTSPVVSAKKKYQLSIFIATRCQLEFTGLFLASLARCNNIKQVTSQFASGALHDPLTLYLSIGNYQFTFHIPLVN